MSKPNLKEFVKRIKETDFSKMTSDSIRSEVYTIRKLHNLMSGEHLIVFDRGNIGICNWKDVAGMIMDALVESSKPLCLVNDPTFPLFFVQGIYVYITPGTIVDDKFYLEQNFNFAKAELKRWMNVLCNERFSVNADESNFAELAMVDALSEESPLAWKHGVVDCVRDLDMICGSHHQSLIVDFFVVRPRFSGYDDKPFQFEGSYLIVGVTADGTLVSSWFTYDVRTGHSELTRLAKFACSLTEVRVKGNISFFEKCLNLFKANPVRNPKLKSLTKKWNKFKMPSEPGENAVLA